MKTWAAKILAVVLQILERIRVVTIIIQVKTVHQNKMKVVVMGRMRRVIHLQNQKILSRIGVVALEEIGKVLAPLL